MRPDGDEVEPWFILELRDGQQPPGVGDRVTVQGTGSAYFAECLYPEGQIAGVLPPGPTSPPRYVEPVEHGWVKRLERIQPEHGRGPLWRVVLD